MTIEELIDTWLAEGATPDEVRERLERLERLALEQHLGLVAVVTLDDGSGAIVERDPFADLSTTPHPDGGSP